MTSPETTPRTRTANGNTANGKNTDGKNTDGKNTDGKNADGKNAGGRNSDRTPRATRQRAAVSALLDRLDDFRSAQEIHEELRRSGHGIGLTTVYRTLQAMVDSGELDMLRTASGEAVYRRCSSHHHHHLVCRECGRTIEVEGPAVESWAQRVAAEYGFSELSHTVEIFGRCPACTAVDRPAQ